MPQKNTSRIRELLGALKGQPVLLGALGIAVVLAACSPTTTVAPPTSSALPSPLAVTLGPDPGPQGDPDGSGTALISLNPNTDEICFELNVADISLPARAAHIHQGRAEENGPIVVGLAPPDANGAAKGCRSVSSETLHAILKTPSEYYVLVHTPESGLTEGALRGQLP